MDTDAVSQPLQIYNEKPIQDFEFRVGFFYAVLFTVPGDEDH